MTEKPIIKSALPKDAGGIAAVRKLTWLATYVTADSGLTEEDIEQEEIDSSKRIDKIVEKIKGNNNNHTWVAKDKEKIVGFCTAAKGLKPAINALYILPKYQSQGLGKKFMELALKWLGDKKDIFAEVATYNTKAIKFYEKVGFINTEKISKFKLKSGKTIPTYILVIPNHKSIRHDFYCPYCGNFIIFSWVEAYGMPEPGLEFNCKKCALHYLIYFEDDEYPKNPWLNVKFLTKPLRLFCVFCGKPNILVEKIDKERTHSSKNVANWRYKFHECPKCKRHFELFKQD